MRTHVRRKLAGLTTATLVTAGLLAGCGSDADPADDDVAEASAAQEESPAPEAAAAADWLLGQLEDGLVVTSFEDPPGSGKWSSSPDLGLSLDVWFALGAVGVGDPERAAILDAIEPQAGVYVGVGKDAYAGSTGKLLTAVQASGTDPADYADGDLLPRLEGLVHADADDEQGRAKDTWDPKNEWGGDYSNTIGQSFVVRALVGADSDLADETTEFLLKQQCEEGYFRLGMDSKDFTCDGGTAEQSKASVDATAFAVSALLAVEEAGVEEVDESAVDEAVSAARDWLVSAQAEDGSFADADSGASNANSTGVAGEALVALGETQAAASAADWLRAHQTPDGAVAYDHAALETAEKNGITRDVRYQWRRATAQAVAALDAGDAGAE